MSGFHDYRSGNPGSGAPSSPNGQPNQNNSNNPNGSGNPQSGNPQSGQGSNSPLPPGFTGVSIAMVGPQGPGSPSGSSSNSDVPEQLINYNERFKDANPVLFRDEVITSLESALISRSKSNALLLGPAGVGKTAIVEELARRIANDDPSVPDNLKGTTIYELPFASMAAGNGMVGALEQEVQNIIAFFTNPDNKAICFIDEIHQMVDAHDSISTKIAQIFKPALARGDMHLIGATTTQEAKTLTNDPAFRRRLTDVIVDELEVDQTIQIIKSVAHAEYAHFNNRFHIDDTILEAIPKLADKYLPTGHRPDNAITLLDRACSQLVIDTQYAHMHNPSIVFPMTLEHVNKVGKAIATGQSTPISIDFDKLSADLSHVLGQETVTSKVPDLLRRRDLNVLSTPQPTVWMFTGGSGIGKTEVARIVAKHVTGSDPIVLNMAEYSESHTISRILGSPKGYVGSTDNDEKPLDALISNPNQVIVLDEVEKAHTKVKNAFLSAFDSGQMRMANGQMINFSEALVILTSNAAKKELMNSSLGFGARGTTRGLDTSTAEGRLKLNKALEKDFPSEFLGRISWIVNFEPIEKDLYRDILHDKYAVLSRDICENNPHFAAYLPDELPEETYDMLMASYHRDYGARPAGREVLKVIEDIISAGYYGMTINIPGFNTVNATAYCHTTTDNS